MNYCKDDYIEYMTNQPELHALEIVGEVNVDPEIVEMEYHVGWIESVIDNGAYYLVRSIAPLEGFRSVEKADNIVRLLNENEITEEMRNIQCNTTFKVPNIYINREPIKGDIDEKCEKIARDAIAALFPEDIVEFVEKDSLSDYIKEDMIKRLDHIQEYCHNERSAMSHSDINSLKKDITTKIRKARFKEYYSVRVGVECLNEYPFTEEQGMTNIHSTRFYQVAIDLNFEEVSVMRDIHERTAFHYSLGPEVDYAEHLLAEFRFEEE